MINIYKEFKTQFLSSPDLGEKMAKMAIDKNCFSFDFSNIEIVTTAFFNKFISVVCSDGMSISELMSKMELHKMTDFAKYAFQIAYDIQVENENNR